MSEFTVCPMFTVDRNFIDGVLTVAFEGGSNYWIRNVCADDTEVDVYSNWVAHGGSVWVYLEDDNTRHMLTRSGFLTGFQKYLEDGLTNRRQVYLNLADIDADEADMILQYALFGELVYS